MPRLLHARRFLLITLAVVVVALLAGSVVGFNLVRRSVPDVGGELAVRGLTAEVNVLRDAQGVPQIYADNAEDLFLAQGYVHAQDRFFEMDLRRHITSGRLSEMVGEAGLEPDRVIRTMGWRRVAEAELPTLAPTTRRYLQAYADGVNAWIDSKGSPAEMSLEYVALGQRFPGYRVEDWTPADSLAWLKAMAWDLRSNYDDELSRARLFGRVTPAQIADAYPAYDYTGRPPILSDRDWKPGAVAPTSAGSAVPTYAGAGTPGARAAYAAVQDALQGLPEMVGRGDGVGSNSWVVGPDRSSTGKPLLANDPHLSVGIPGIWFQAGLHCRELSEACPFDVSGFTFAGLPGVVIGHNQDIAWGFTNLAPDVSDFYLEQVRDATYLRDGEWVDLQTRRETIDVAGGTPRTITVRSTVHGPILSDAIDVVADAGTSPPVQGEAKNGRYAVSLAWTGLVPAKTADSIFAMNRATNFTQFRSAAEDFAAPSQNLVYADTDGHIGYQAPGLIPVRRSSTEGAPPGYWPAPGWESEYDWTGYVDFDDLPWAYDPPEGMIVAANQAVTASRSPFLTSEYDAGFRSTRIRDLLEASKDPITPADMVRIQGDTRNGLAPVLVEKLLAIDLDDDPFTREAQELLEDWDFSTPADGSDGQERATAAAAYYNSVWDNIQTLLFDDELSAGLESTGGSRWMEVVRRLLDKPRSGWWDNKSTPGVGEGMDAILRQALVQARLDLTEQLGKEPSSWEWGKLHQLTLRHEVLGAESEGGVVDRALSSVLQRIFNRGPYAVPGGSSIVNANGWNAAEGFEVTTGPSMRMVVDLADLDASTWVNQTGVSGHAYSDHYDDQIERWIANEPYPWPFTEDAVREASDDEQVLKPPE